MIEAKIVADSVGPNGIRLTTFVLTYPRFIHSEFLTHRVFSRNASSSRAIPVKRTLRNIRSNMVIPSHIGANQAGMQASSEVSGCRKALALLLWKGLGHTACLVASLLDRLGVHKQVVNRVTEPWSHITVVCTATDWDNWFALRNHPMAQPEIMELAQAMLVAMGASQPEELEAGQWHLPFIHPAERVVYGERVCIIRSVARCARVSYLNHDGTKPTVPDDVSLYNRLLGSQPIHASPAEHQAMATSPVIGFDATLQGNLRGWIQYRKTLLGENPQS